MEFSDVCDSEHVGVPNFRLDKAEFVGGDAYRPWEQEVGRSNLLAPISHEGIERELALWGRDRLNLRGRTESAKAAVSERCAANSAENRRLVFLRFQVIEEVDYDTFGRKDTQGVIPLYVFSLHTKQRERFRCGRVNANDFESFLP